MDEWNRAFGRGADSLQIWNHFPDIAPNAGVVRIPAGIYYCSHTIDLAGTHLLASGVVVIHARRSPMFSCKHGAIQIDGMTVNAAKFISIDGDLESLTLSSCIHTGTKENYSTALELSNRRYVRKISISSCQFRETQGIILDGLRCSIVSVEKCRFEDCIRYALRFELSVDIDRVNFVRNEVIRLSTGSFKGRQAVARVLQGDAIESIVVCDNRIEDVYSQNGSANFIYWARGNLLCSRNSVMGVCGTSWVIHDKGLSSLYSVQILQNDFVGSLNREVDSRGVINTSFATNVTIVGNSVHGMRSPLWVCRVFRDYLSTSKPGNVTISRNSVREQWSSVVLDVTNAITTLTISRNRVHFANAISDIYENIESNTFLSIRCLSNIRKGVIEGVVMFRNEIKSKAPVSLVTYSILKTGRSDVELHATENCISGQGELARFRFLVPKSSVFARNSIPNGFASNRKITSGVTWVRNRLLGSSRFRPEPEPTQINSARK